MQAHRTDGTRQMIAINYQITHRFSLFFFSLVVSISPEPRRIVSISPIERAAEIFPRINYDVRKGHKVSAYAPAKRTLAE